MEFNKYFYIFSFCFITEGKSQFSIYDSKNKKMHQFDMGLYDVAKNLFRNKRVNEILESFNDNDSEVILSFIDFLLSNDMGCFVDDIDNFPLINESWDSPFKIKRCIIDIRDVWHDFDSIFSQLTELLCPKIEIRSYRVLSLREIKKVIEVFEKYDFGVLFLLFPYSEKIFTADSSEALSKIIAKDYRVLLNIYNVNDDQKLKIEKIKDKYTPLSCNVNLVAKSVLGKDDCGVINHNNFHEMTIDDIMENKKHNGCLNRLISIDENGLIKNCPSMVKEYGNIKETSLLDVYQREDFKRLWNISNSMIEGCLECELRIVCLGCRAYLIDRSNIYSKPAKCNYNSGH